MCPKSWQETTCAEVSFFNIAAGWRLATLLQRNSGTVLFLWILHNFCNFVQCFWKPVWIIFSQVPPWTFSGVDVRRWKTMKISYSAIIIFLMFVPMEEQPDLFLWQNLVFLLRNFFRIISASVDNLWIIHAWKDCESWMVYHEIA